MKKRGGFKLFEIVILLLPVVVLAAVALISSRARMVNRHMSTLSGLALLFRHPRDFILAFVALQAFSFVIIVLVLFLQTMIDRVAPPFEKPGDDQSS